MLWAVTGVSDNFLIFWAALLVTTTFFVCYQSSGLHNVWQPGSGKMEREWENEVEMERKWGNGQRMRKWREIYLFSSYFLSLYPFPDQKLSIFVTKCYIRHSCRKCHKKTYHTCYEKIILGRESSASCEGPSELEHLLGQKSFPFKCTHLLSSNICLLIIILSPSLLL